MNTKTILAGAAVAGLLSGSAVTSFARSVPSSGGVQITTMAEKGVHSCKGQNGCKGQGGCKAGDNGCKGKNTCKGKGGCATDGSKK